MLDLLFKSQKAERHPIEMVLIGIFYSSLSILLGSWIFDSSQSLAIVFLTVLSCLYVVQGAIRVEEKKEKNYNSEKWILKEHKGVVILIVSLFVGFMISFTLWSFFLPEEIGLEIFDLQKTSIDQIKVITGKAIFPDSFSIILFNNLKIILISLIFALFYGAGAIYILVWNASVMGYVMGTIVRESTNLLIIPTVMFKYSLHGLPEMLAYILAAIAGGILYFAFLRGDLLRKERLKRIIIDIGVLVLISVILLILAALVEIYVSTFL